MPSHPNSERTLRLRRTILLSLSLAAAALAAATAVSAGQPDDSIAVVGEAIAALSALADAIPTTTSTTAACTDDSCALGGMGLNTTYKSYYNPSGAPASVASTALTSLQSAFQVVANGQNRCNNPSNLTTSQLYGGSTTKVAQISTNGTCTGNDGYSVTSWGSPRPLTSPMPAFTTGPAPARCCPRTCSSTARFTSPRLSWRLATRRA
jgi:hypothetical protein